MLTGPLIGLPNFPYTTSPQTNTVSLASDNTYSERNHSPSKCNNVSCANDTIGVITNDEALVVKNGEDVAMINNEQVEIQKEKVKNGEDVLMINNDQVEIHKEIDVSRILIDTDKDIGADCVENMMDYSDSALSDVEKEKLVIQVPTNDGIYYPPNTIPISINSKKDGICVDNDDEMVTDQKIIECITSNSKKGEIEPISDSLVRDNNGN